VTSGIVRSARQRVERALGISIRRATAPRPVSVSLGGREVPLSHPLFQISDEDISASRITERASPSEVRSATWLVPYFRHLSYGGIYTIFRFISGFAAAGVHNRIVVYDRPSASADALRAEIGQVFPNLADADLVIFDIDRDRVEDLPPTDIGVCTFWASAYLLLRLNSVARKYYFIQDYEPLFYLAGSTYALAESTYRFGFTGIVNTPGLFDAVKARHDVDGISFVPAVDRRFYYPPERRNSERVRVFFYARPNQPRNAFELCLLTVERLLATHGDRIEVVAAGSVWDADEYGLGDRITNVGLLESLEEVGQLYRSCHIGFVYSLSKHPSYQPFEFMACGMGTVTNRNEDTLWLLKDRTNCLLSEASPRSMAEKVGELVEDSELFERVAAGGLATISNDWDSEVRRVSDYVLGRS